MHRRLRHLRLLSLPFQSPEVNYGQKILCGKFQKYAIAKFKSRAAPRCLTKTHESCSAPPPTGIRTSSDFRLPTSGSQLAVECAVLVSEAPLFCLIRAQKHREGAQAWPISRREAQRCFLPVKRYDVGWGEAQGTQGSALPAVSGILHLQAYTWHLRADPPPPKP